MAKSKEELKNLLMKVKEESEKAGLKLKIQKAKIMASSPITSCQIDGKQWKQGQTLFWGAPKSLKMMTTAMKLRHLLLGRKAMANLDSTVKSRDIISPTKVHLVKAIVFPVVMCGCESWTIKKAEHQRIDTFNLWLEKPFESPLDSKEIQPVYPKGDESWVFIGRTEAEVEAPILWPPHEKN